MIETRKNMYCGPEGINLDQLFGIGDSFNTAEWFGNGKVYYSYKGKTAIRYACDLLGIIHSDEILVPSYNCGSEIDPLIQSGASVVLYRIDKTGRIDIDDLNYRITGRTKVIYITHYFGFPQPITRIKKICKENGIYLIEDCALSLFSCDGSSRLGTIGDVSIFSFKKTLPVPDGGGLAINNPSLVPKNWSLSTPHILEVMGNILPLLKSSLLKWSERNILFYSLLWRILKRKNQGHKERNALSKFPDMPDDYYYNNRLNDMAISSISKYFLQRFNQEAIKIIRRNNYMHFLKLVTKNSNIEPLYTELKDGVCPLYFPVILKNGNRKETCKKLNEKSIAAIAWWSGYHRLLPWEEFKDACYLKDNVIVLPIHKNISYQHIEYIVENLINCVK